MARLQILELPEGSDDNRPPFLLVVDQYEPCRYVMGLDQTEQPISEFDGIAEKIGARTDERIEPTPGQWIWHWNRATPEKRLSMASQILDGMKRSNDCLMADHEARLAHLRGELERLNAERSAAETPNA
jgi:hypothetical protein